MQDELLWLELERLARIGASLGNPRHVDAARREDCVQDALLFAWQRYSAGATADELKASIVRYTRRRLYAESDSHEVRQRIACAVGWRRWLRASEWARGREILLEVVAVAEELGCGDLVSAIAAGDSVPQAAIRIGIPRATAYWHLKKLAVALDNCAA